MTSATRVSADSPAAVARTVMSRSVIMPTRPVLSQTGRAPTLSSSITCAARCRLSSGRTTCTLRVMKSEIFCMGGLAKRDVGDRTFEGRLANRAPVFARPLQGLVTSCAARRRAAPAAPAAAVPRPTARRRAPWPAASAQRCWSRLARDSSSASSAPSSSTFGWMYDLRHTATVLRRRAATCAITCLARAAAGARRRRPRA